MERATAEFAAAFDSAGLDEAPPAVALVRLLDAGWQVTARYPLVWHLPAVSPEQDASRHAPVLGRLLELIRRGQDSGDLDATLGLDEFSHIEVVFHFHKESRIRRGAAHPRGNPAWPLVGALAGHSPVRPNHLGVARCALLAVAGLELTVRGLDAVDGTPVPRE